MFERRKYFDLQATTFFLNRDVKPKLVRSANPDQALSLLIENNMEEVEMFENTKSSTNPEGEINQKPKTILVVLHDPSEPANIRSRSLEVPLGYSSKVYITPEATVTDVSAHAMPEKDRNCRLRGETGGLEIFKTYSREACTLECQLKQAVESCGCQPWDFPIIADNQFYVCDVFGNICIERSLKNSSLGLGCHCPMDCDSVSYSYSIVSTPISEKEQCSTKGDYSIFEEFYKRPFPPKFIRRTREFLGIESLKEADVCKKLLPYRAEVTFRLATDTVSVTVRSRRLSFFDKLSAFGN